MRVMNKVDSRKIEDLYTLFLFMFLLNEQKRNVFKIYKIQMIFAVDSDVHIKSL